MESVSHLCQSLSQVLELEGEFSWIPFIGAIQFWLQDKLACMLGYIRLGAICKNKLNQAGNTLISLFQQTDSSVVFFCLWNL